MEQISVNLIPSGIKGTCHASQFDIGRSIRFALLSGSNIYTLSGSETITMKIRKPDGTERTETLANTSSTYVDLVTNRDTCDQSGTYDCEITVTDGGVVIGSGNFTMEVEADSLDGLITIKTASGAVASFETSLPFPLNEAKFTLPYRAEGYTELTHYKATSTPVKDNSPYRLRKAPSGIGNKCIEKLIGASVNFNQLQKNDASTSSENGITYTNNGDGSFHVSGTFSSRTYKYFDAVDNIPVSGGHVYYFNGNCVIPNGAFLVISFYENSTWLASGYINHDLSINGGNIVKAPSNCNKLYLVAIDFTADTQIGLEVDLTIKPQLCDLTAFFGSSAIADHLYNLETQTAGAGVAKFKALGFDAPYYPYTAGQLMSSAPVAKKIVGKNLFGGDYNVKFSIFIPEGTEMTASCKKHDGTNSKIQYFRKDGTQIDFWALNVETADGTRQYRIFTLQEDIYSVSFYGAECEEMQLEFGSSATNYEPYKEEMTIYSGEELRGIFELDSNNNIVANGDEDDGSGTGAVRFIKITVDGSEDEAWSNQTMLPNLFSYTDLNIKDSDNQTTPPKLITNSSLDIQTQNNLVGESTLEGIGIFNWGNQLVIRKAGITSVAEMRAFLSSNPITFVTLIATPTTKSIRTWDNPQPAMAGGTEEFIDGNEFSIVDLGSLSWTYYSAEAIFYTTISGTKTEYNYNAVCDKYEYSNSFSGDKIWNNSLYFGGGINLMIKDSAYTDATVFKNAMNGVYLIYENTNSVGFQMPTGHDTIYADNLKYSKKTFAQIYGGDLDAVTGVLTSRYNSDGSQKTTPEIIQLTPEAIIALLGTNTVWNDAGNTEVKYVDLKGEGT